MRAVRIGYQGDIGSNAEEAAHIFGERIELDGSTWIEYVPLVTAERVFTELEQGNISLGVVAVVNSLGGVVSETRNMLDHAGLNGWTVTFIDEHVLPIHHCLYAKTPDAEIHHIASHEQALKQTTEWRDERYPYADTVETIDTAYAARMLDAGVLAEDVAVICRKNVGEELGLALIAENIEDGLSYTTFHLLSGKSVEE